jgi:hypothetical protein
MSYIGRGSDIGAGGELTAAEEATVATIGGLGSGLQVLRTNAGATAVEWVSSGGTGDLLADGSIPLTANWDVGAFKIRAQTFESDIATGSAPFTVASTTVVANLQAATVATITGLAPDTATTQATQASITTCSNLVTVGALDSGSITSGFGSIDVGSSAITTTGVITGGTVEATTDISAGDNAAMGYTATEGLILTGQGSTYDVVVKNDADTDVIQIPTGTTTVQLPALTGSEIVITNANKGLASAAVATYPSLTELTYVKGVTSAIQTQIDAKGTGTWTDSSTSTGSNKTFVAPALGTPASGVMTNVSGTASSLTAGNVTTNANLTGHVTSTGNAAILGSFTVSQLSSALSDASISGNNTGDEASANTTTAGIIEIATSAETTTGTDSGRAVSPDGLAGSEFGEKAIQMVVFDFTTDTATGDGKFYFHIDSRLAGMNLVDVHAEVITAGTTGTTDIQLRNVTQTADILSTKLTIDSADTGSDTAATPAVIDAAQDDMTENDVIAIDVDAISTTAAKGLIITLGFRLP